MTDPVLQKMDNLIDSITSIPNNESKQDDCKDEKQEEKKTIEEATSSKPIYIENPKERELYDKINDKQSRQRLLKKFKPNPTLWTNKFRQTVESAQHKPSSNFKFIFHGLRILIQKQTLITIKNNSYHTINGKKIILNNDDICITAKKTKFYTSNHISNIPKNEKHKSKETQNNIDIDVLNIDCLDAAYSLLCNNYNPCLLNMANQKTPGGGWKSGAGAQEENLCRRSTLLTSLCNYSKNLINYPKNKQNILDIKRVWKYPMDDYGGIYSPNIIVFRSNETSGYKFLDIPYKMSMITAAMFREKKRKPNYNKNLEYKNDYKSKIIQKLKSVLRIAYDNGHDAVVLSAWGCGAFKNPPLGQSNLWKYVLCNDNEFKGKFKKIVFAIFDDHNTGSVHNPFGNVLPFIEVFDITQKRMKELFVCSKKDINVVGELCSIFKNIDESEESRDLDYIVVYNKFVNMLCAMQILYCGGFKRSSDGSRLQLENKRIHIAQNVYQMLLKGKT
eukprot:101844_1